MRGAAGFIAVQLAILLPTQSASAQATPTAQDTPIAPLLASGSPARLVLSLPSLSASFLSADAATSRWQLPAPTLRLARVAPTRIATEPVQTADGELRTEVASVPLGAVNGLAFTAQGTVLPKLQLECSTTCQQQVQGSLGLEARVLIAGSEDQANAALFVRAEQVSARPNSERRLRVGVLGAF